jgi:hypothetical protein
MTLPELLISMVLIGVLGAVVSMAIVVTYRQADSTEGRINVARAEQSLDTWLPTDLASTDVSRTDLPAVDTDPAASPCGNCGGLDLSGSNALQLAWVTMVPGSPPTEVVTRVQYQYIRAGSEYQLQRIECVGTEPCGKVTVLHDLDGPPDPATYDPDTTAPAWVFDVSVPEDTPDLDLAGNARRISVTVNGGGSSAGRGGGENTISLTAGGVETGEIEADAFSAPSFVRAKSRCGGPVTLIVDDSGSITQSNVDNVIRPGVEAFIEAFRGTPTQIQVVQFSGKAQTLGPITTDPSGWHRYVDMTDDAQVDQLKASLAALTASGGTNWEEAFFHALKRSDGSPAPVVPRRIVFFTDGIPTLNRTSTLSGWPAGSFINGSLVHYNDGPYGAGWPIENGSAFHQESYDRADVILDQHRVLNPIDLIFVGVGPSLGNNVSWIYNQAVYTNRNAPPSSPTTIKASDVIANLLTDRARNEVPAQIDGSGTAYTNADTANFYLQSSFNQAAFAAAMRASALKDCGGTVTIQTRYANGTPVPREIWYENPQYRDDTGAVVTADSRRVSTSAAFRTGTFDFEIPSSVSHYSVDVMPQEWEQLTQLTPLGWSCRVGTTPRATTSIPIDGSAWTGITVDVYPNEAVSCIVTVAP